MTNPLRYPGGKYFLAEYIAKVLEFHSLSNCIFYEPYAGSAAVSLKMLSIGLASEIVLLERDPMIYSFWKAVTESPEQLCKEIDRLDINLETWHRLAPLRQAKTPLEYPTLVLGLAGLFFNRTNYSGILNANPIGGKRQNSRYTIDCRFPKENIKSHIMAIARYRERITVKWGDAIHFLKEHRSTMENQRCFVYIDPPYYEKGKSLYRYYYVDDDHRALASLLRICTFPWLVSYDDHPFITDLYFSQAHGYWMQRLYLDYNIHNRNHGRELLISNVQIPPIAQKQSGRANFA